MTGPLPKLSGSEAPTVSDQTVLTIKLTRKIVLPFTIEGDSGGHSYITEEGGKFYQINQVHGQSEPIDRREITRERATEIIKETMEMPFEERFPSSRRPSR